MPTAYSYVRLSSSRQIQGDGVRRQLAKTREYCERNGLSLDEGLRLSDLGVSGFRSKNSKFGALAEFLAAAESGRIAKGSILIIESLDRLSRDQISEALQLFLRIIQSGVDIVTLEPERRHSRDSINDLSGILEPIIIMSRANEESATKSARITAKWEQRRIAAREGTAGGKSKGKLRPWWLDFNKVENRYVPIPDRVAVVREIFRLREGGYGMVAIVKKLNNEPWEKPRFASHWTTSGVNNILKTRKVIGEYQPNKVIDGRQVPDGDPVEGYYPAVIEREQFFRVQEGAKQRPGRAPVQEEVNLFSGLVFNGFDLHPMYAYTGSVKYKNKTYHYRNWMSQGHISGMAGSDGSRIKYETMETAFLKFVSELKPSDFSKDTTGVFDRIALVTGKLAEAEHKERVIKGRIKDLPAADILPFLDLVSDLDREKKALASELDALKSQASNADVDAVGELRTLADLLGKTTEEDASKDLRLQIRSRIARLVERIELFPKVSDKRGKCFKVQFQMFVKVFFKDGTERWFVQDHEANVDLNVKVGEFFEEGPVSPE
ncbi:recombinase family protein [Singulisphaera rosea]